MDTRVERHYLVRTSDDEFEVVLVEGPSHVRASQGNVIVSDDLHWSGIAGVIRGLADVYAELQPTNG
jgi:hypothetical protein